MDKPAYIVANGQHVPIAELKTVYPIEAELSRIEWKQVTVDFQNEVVHHAFWFVVSEESIETVLNQLANSSALVVGDSENKVDSIDYLSWKYRENGAFAIEWEHPASEIVSKLQ